MRGSRMRSVYVMAQANINLCYYIFSKTTIQGGFEDIQVTRCVAKYRHKFIQGSRKGQLGAVLN